MVIGVVMVILGIVHHFYWDSIAASNPELSADDQYEFGRLFNAESLSSFDGRVNGKPIYHESGKVMKGPNYFKPDLSKFVN